MPVRPCVAMAVGRTAADLITGLKLERMKRESEKMVKKRVIRNRVHALDEGVVSSGGVVSGLPTEDVMKLLGTRLSWNGNSV